MYRDASDKNKQIEKIRGGNIRKIAGKKKKNGGNSGKKNKKNKEKSMKNRKYENEISRIHSCNKREHNKDKTILKKGNTLNTHKINI